MVREYCSNCGADLRMQDDYVPGEGHWICTECGQLLLNPEIDDSGSQFPGIGWYCDSCNAYLNDQDGFSDWNGYWTCEECGYNNTISSEEIYESKAAYEKYATGEILGSAVSTFFKGFSNGLSNSFSSDDDEEDDEYDDNDEDELEEQEPIVRKVRSPKKSLSQKLWQAITRKKMEVGVSSANCLKLRYEDVERALRKRGFENIELIPCEELENSDKEDFVKRVTINGIDSFASQDMFLYNAEIEIYYLKVKMIGMPFHSRKMKGLQAEEVEKMLQDCGFNNINMVAMHDVVFGWLKKEGEVDSVLIWGNKVRKNQSYRIDSPISIRYHAAKFR